MRYLSGGKHVSAVKDTNATIENAVFYMRSVPGLYEEDQMDREDQVPCGGGVEYLHRSPASRRRRRKGNPVPGGITGPPCLWG
jgi:hypothetical protein